MENGAVVHLYDSLIKGAGSLATWVRENVPITLSDLQEAPPLRAVVKDIATKLRPDDLVVAHNVRFDMEQCLRRSAAREEIEGSDLDFILGLPRFCTQNCEYVKSTLRKGERRLAHLCAHFGVEFHESSAHDATYDAQKLAECVEEALFRGVMLPDVHAKPSKCEHSKMFTTCPPEGGPGARSQLEHPALSDAIVQEILSRPLG